MSDVSTSGDGVLSEKAHTWLDGLGAAKQFLKQYREYNKSVARNKKQKLLEMVDVLGRCTSSYRRMPV